MGAALLLHCVLCAAHGHTLLHVLVSGKTTFLKIRGMKRGSDREIDCMRESHNSIRKERKIYGERDV